MSQCLMSSPTVFAGVLEEFDRYLSEVRGLRPATRECYARWVLPFLVEVARGGDAVPLMGIEPLAVRNYVTAASGSYCPASVKLIGTSIRAFLRFAFVTGRLSVDLTDSVGIVVTHRSGRIPKALSRGDLVRLLSGPDRSLAVGARDYAILVLMVRLGLRAGEVAGLTLDDFRWRAGIVNPQVKGGARTLLPLPSEVTEAVVSYLRVRPAFESRAVFVAVKGRRRPMTRGAVTAVVERYAERAGLGPVRAHRLRHTLAREVLDGGGSLAEVGQLLGHADQQTTMMYSSFDLDMLRPLARPWPVGGR